MLIWLFFFVIVYFLIYKFGCSVSKKVKNIYYTLLLVIIVYYSAFRDGLGMDYSAYAFYCEHHMSTFESFILGQEPFAAAIEALCYNTHFSAVIFFLITSLITCVLCTLVYKQYMNAVIAFFVFVTYTNLYLMSFNLVRQFVAAAIILIGSYYFIIQKRSYMYFLFIMVAFLFHKSAVLFALLYFLRKSEVNSTLWTIIIIASWIIPVQPLFNLPIIHELLVMGNYEGYLNFDQDSYSKTSLSNIYMHGIVLFCLWKWKKFENKEGKEHFIFALKMVAISIICCNLSAGDLPFAYRIAIYCSVFIPILFTFIPDLFGRKLLPVIVYIPFCVLFWTLLYVQRDNKIYCPERLLPIEGIYDKHYKPYDNPDVSFEKYY